MHSVTSESPPAWSATPTGPDRLSTCNFRAENTFLPLDYQRGTNANDYRRIIDEMTAYLATGIDGFFTGQADIGVLARDNFVRAR